MNDTLFVCGFQRLGDLARNRQRFIERERTARDAHCQILTLGQRVIGLQLARRLAKEWLGYIFDPDSPSTAKVNEIIEYEDKITG